VETDNDLFLEMVEGVTPSMLERIGDDPEASYQLFRRFVELAGELAPGPSGSRVGQAGPFGGGLGLA
jgi:hypothetical protein